MRHVVPQDLLLKPAQGGAHGRDLGDDVDAIAIVLDHFRQPANLTLDPAQPLLTGCLDVLPHALYIPPWGMGCKRAAGECGDRTGKSGSSRHRSWSIGRADRRAA